MILQSLLALVYDFQCVRRFLGGKWECWNIDPFLHKGHWRWIRVEEFYYKKLDRFFAHRKQRHYLFLNGSQIVELYRALEIRCRPDPKWRGLPINPCTEWWPKL